MPGRWSRLSNLERYLVALTGVAAAAGVRWLLSPILGNSAQYLLQYIAVLLAARYLGFGPALAGLVLGTSSAFYAAAIHHGRLSISDPRFWWRIAVIYVSGIFLVWLLDRQRRMRGEVESTTRMADERLEQLSIEVAQREREQKFSAQLRAIVESSDDAIISKDLNGTIQSWNHGAEQIYGYTAEEAIGNTISLVVPLDRMKEELDMIEHIRQGGRAKHFETIRLRKDGRQIHVSLSTSPIRDQKGCIVGISHISRDITERKAWEEQLRQTQKLESLGVLAGGLAHDFNNLLTGVMGNASLAIDELPEGSPVRSRIAEVLSGSERAAMLVRQMLAYAGKGRFVLEPLNLSLHVAEIVPLIRTSFAPNVTLNLQLAENLPPIDGDPSQIQQLIMNLAINAAEALGGEPGTVTISTSTRETEAERQVVLEVRDTGCGMDEGTKARIFDPFFTTKFTGRGLGLAAVLGIIRGHHGFISVESTPGRGSTFTIILPVASDRALSKGEMDVRGYGHVLVVDDEDLVRNMVRFTLEHYGYTVQTAADGLSALALLSDDAVEFDAVLLDLAMPVLNGEETLKRIQQIRTDVRVVLSSAFTEAEALRRFGDRRLAGFLQKPYTASVLARKIKQALRTRMG
jgi:two-component system, chemotaxis family, CheB/CheR fusion protein